MTMPCAAVWSGVPASMVKWMTQVPRGVTLKTASQISGLSQVESEEKGKRERECHEWRMKKFIEGRTG